MRGESGWRRSWVALAVVCAVSVGCIALPSSGLASTRIGSNLTADPSVGLVCGANCPILFADTSLPPGAPPVTSPITGTIVRWQIKTGGGGNESIRLRVLAPASGGNFTGAGTGDYEMMPTTITTTPFSAQLPIQAGDYIGVDATNKILAIANGVTAANTAQFHPTLADNGTPASPINNTDWELLVNADVAALPTSSVAISSCDNSGQTLTATVTPDPDPAVAAKAIHFRLDGGSEQTAPTSGNPGTAAVVVANGSHTLEYWGEDSVGGLESPHHTASIAGCSATPGPTLGTLPVRATVSSLFQTHPVFRVGANSTPLLGGTTRLYPRGTTFSFRLDQPATVTLRIQRKLPGRRVGRVCRRPTLLLRSRPRCTRLVLKATLRRTARVGLNRIRFSGRIRGRALRPGRYRAAFTAANAAGTSPLRALSFRIVAPRP